jgi:MFS family permease
VNAQARRAVVCSALGAGVSFSNLSVALPLLALAEHRSAFIAGALLGVNTLAFSAGAAAALLVGRAQAAIALGIGSMAAGAVAFLSLPSAPAPLVAGALAQGIGMGLFWVGTQASLGRRSGASGSQRAFVRQYVLYIVGTAAGAALTGAVIAVLRKLGVAYTDSVRASFAVGAGATLGALPAVIAWARTQDAAPARRVIPKPWHGIALQVPDLLLVSAMAMQLNLVPIVLDREFRFTPLAISIVVGAIAAAKIAGSFAAGRLTPATGARPLVGAMLGLSALCVAVLIATHAAWIFVTLTVSAAFFAIGVWPLVVDGALARVSPAQRRSLSIVWNVREYATIAVSTALGGYLLHAHGQSTLQLALDSALLCIAAAGALLVLARPIHAPRSA